MDFGFPQQHSHEFVLFFYPSPGLNWTNPKSLTFTTVRNKLLGLPRGIGHATVMIRTPDSFALTGMTQLHPREGRKEILWEGHGLGILLHNFQGALETPEKLVPELLVRSKKPGKLSYLRVKASPEAAQRALHYLEEYRRREFYRYYGMKNRPLHGEGSGCSAFAASFLEISGLLHEEFRREWTRSFNIPHELVGGPITGRKVSVLELLRKADRWALEGEPHEKGFFWDPDLMHQWTIRTHESTQKNRSSLYLPENWNHAVGLGLDATNHPVPSGKIFRIDES